MNRPTLNQIYHAFQDTMRDGRDHIERMVDGTHVDVDWIYCDLITTILEVPGVKEAVLLAALKNDSTGYVSIKDDGLERVGDIPFQYIWTFLMNPVELGLEEEQP